MSENRDSSQPQRYCHNCGAEIKSGNSFCVSCGVRLDSQTRDTEAREGLPRTTDDIPPAGTEHPNPGPLNNDYGAGSKLGLGSLMERLGRLGFLGLLALISGGLIASVVLSPLVLLAVILLFGVSLIGLIVRIGQRRSVFGWGGVVVGSFALILLFSGISNLLYEGLLGFSGTDYRVVNSDLSSKGLSFSSRTVPTLSLVVLSNSTDEDGIRDIVGSIVENDLAETEVYGSFQAIELFIFDSDTTIEDPSEPLFGVRPRDPKATLEDLEGVSVQANLSSNRYKTFFGPLPAGYYEVSSDDNHCDMTKPETCSSENYDRYPIPNQ